MKHFTLFLFLVVFSFHLCAQNDRADELLKSDCMQGGSASVLVYDLDKGEELYSYDPQRALPTASIQKMMTTAAVLHQRGAGFKYKTIIGHTGKIKNGVLEGDLVVVGSGDPTLGSGYFEDAWTSEEVGDSLVAYLHRMDVHAVSGALIMDVSSVPGQHVPGGWPWSDMGNYYGAGHWAVNIHDNEYKLFFRQNTTPGEAPIIMYTVPDLGTFKINNEVLTGPSGSGDQAYIYSAPYSTAASVRGTIPPGKGSFSIRGSLPNPPLFFGRYLSESLHKSEIRMNGEAKLVQIPVSGVSVLFTISSPSLLDIIRVTNYKSVNLYAEGLLKLLCDEENTTSQFECGLKELIEFWKSQDLVEDQFFFRDGSGLSPRNTASSQTFVQALRAIYHDKDWYEQFITTLPQMGRDGTLQYMLRGYKGTGLIHAKSGYIGRQRSYAGYITTESGRNLAFCVMLDNFSCSATQMRLRIEGFLIPFLKD